jgi:hypothetical protein
MASSIAGAQREILLFSIMIPLLGFSIFRVPGRERGPTVRYPGDEQNPPFQRGISRTGYIGGWKKYTVSVVSIT